VFGTDTDLVNCVDSAHKGDSVANGTVEVIGFDINTSLTAYYSEEVHITGNTHLSDTLLRSMLRSWEKYAVSEPEACDVCQICFDNVPESDLSRKCQMGMAYCLSCVTGFLETDIKEARVMERGCECVCRSCESYFPPDEIKELVSAESMLKFHKFRNAKLVEQNPLNVYCPNRDCVSVVTLSREGASRARCHECNTKFCVKCSGEHSAFVTCEWAVDSGFRKWKGTTPDGCKRCPNCRMFIEKNGGCSHMTCNGCRHGFCWHCMSPWQGGCSAGKFCTPLGIIRSEKWGSVPVLRETTQVIGITAGVAVGVGVAGAALGAAAALAVGVGVPAVVVGGPIYTTYKGAKKLKKNYMRKKRRRQNGQGNLYLSVDENTELRDELKWGIRVSVPLTGSELYGGGNLTSFDTVFMGIPGRMVEGIFIAYPDMTSQLGIDSPPLYLIPSDTPDGVVERVAGWPMAEVKNTYFSFPDELLELVASDVLQQFNVSSGYASIRRLPASRRGQVNMRALNRSIDNYNSFSIVSEDEYGTSIHSLPPFDASLNEFPDRFDDENVLGDIQQTPRLRAISY
jgi:hypothetical protein